MSSTCFFFFFFNDTATTEIYTLSLHDALPISTILASAASPEDLQRFEGAKPRLAHPAAWLGTDRKSTRLNSSHSQISYAVFCLKKKKKKKKKDSLQESTTNTAIKYTYATPTRL